MIRPAPAVLALAVAAVLAGCKDQSASMMISGPEHALTLSARQPYPWSREFVLEVVMARLPECHRRSRMDGASADEFRVDVFRPAEGVYAEPILLLQQGGEHYALSTRSCEMQRFSKPPTEIGSRLGSFALDGGELKFVAAPALRAAAAPVAIPAAQPRQ